MENLLLLCQASYINTHRENTNINKSSSSALSLANPNTPRNSLDTQTPTYSLPKMPCVVRGLETDQVRAEHSLQQLLAHTQAAEDLGRREGNMQEEANRRGRR